jgi:hypothetical protein
VKYKPHQGNDGILLGGLIEWNDPVNDGEPEPFPTEKTVNGFVFLRAQLEKQDDPQHHPANKHPKSQPKERTSQQFIQAHGILLLCDIRPPYAPQFGPATTLTEDTRVKTLLVG